MEEAKRKEFEKYFNEQFRILRGHHERIMLRVWNKYAELKKSEELRKV